MKDKIFLGLKIIATLVAVVAIVYTTAGCLKVVANTSDQYYCFDESNAQLVEAGKTPLQCRFTAVGREMTAIDVPIATDGVSEGTMAYRIKSTEDELLVEEKDLNLATITGDNTNLYRIDVSELGMVQGQDYILEVDCREANHLSFLMLNGQLVIRQWFQFVHKTLFSVAIMALAVFAFFMVILLWKCGLHPKLFLLMALVFGLVAAIVVPAGSKDDEYRHFIRAYTLARGEKTIALAHVTGNEHGTIAGVADRQDYIVEVPEEINQIRLLDFSDNADGGGYQAANNQRVCIDKIISVMKHSKIYDTDYENNVVKVSAAVTATKPSVLYWPQIAMIWLAQLLHINPILYLYLARFGQLLACVMCLYIGLRLLPKRYDFIWILFGIVNVVSLMASCNTDGLMIALLILALSILLWFRETGLDIISKKAIPADVAYLFITYFVYKNKLPDVLLCVAMLLLLKKQNVARLGGFFKKHAKVLAVLALVAVVGLVIWLICGGYRTVLGILYGFVPEGHVVFIRDNTKYTIKLFCTEWINQVKTLVLAANGSGRIPYALTAILTLILCEKKEPIVLRIYCIVLFAAMMMLMILVGFTMTPPDYGNIWGITYRYMLPFLPLCAVAFASGNKTTQEAVRLVYPYHMIAVMAMTLMGWFLWLNRI
ncbi:MAG: DUF2142 domain-containing protein [Lachnospiraceae bacterium]|nr:DUF2142 domain-containing protein [Lachnospiraceae bacterium]